MTESVTLLSRHEITRQELAKVLIQAGGDYFPGNGCIGRISQGEQSIWVYAGKESLREFLQEYLDILEQDDPVRLEQIRSKLGGEPQAYLEIEIRDTRGSGKLAVDFACRCAENWPCVVIASDPPPRVFSKKEILQLCKEGKGFRIYGM